MHDQFFDFLWLIEKFDYDEVALFVESLLILQAEAGDKGSTAILCGKKNLSILNQDLR